MKIITSSWHQAKGASFEDFFGCEIPSGYGDYEKEYHALRTSVGLRDVSYFAKVRITGRDRQRFLQGMVTNDIKALKAGQGTYALFLDVKGRIQGDMKFYAFPEHFLMVLQHYIREKITSGLDRYIISEDVSMTDVTADWAMFQLLGPEASSFLSSRGLENLPEELYSFQANSVAGVECSVIRLGAGFALLCPADSAVAVLDRLDVQPVGMRAFDVFRIESGMPLIGMDMDETNFPQETRLDAALNFNKGCYLGQETIARIDAQGHVNRHLMGIASSTGLKPGDKLYKGDREIGKITSATHSLLLKQPLSMGYVRREFAKEGEQVSAGNDRTTAIVRQLPVAG
jgi:glycine cleavage system T protein (aminomethyltransferase)